jgi:hypothetical protein|tara:strand:- start:43 stop:288 length:246 start_codon:yes stop_codon:yes gene_type:complete
MANFAYTVLGITQTTLVDAVNDSKFGQPQALSFTVVPSNPIINTIVENPAEFGIFNDTQPGFLTGRRPTTGQLYPRGVYNK